MLSFDELMNKITIYVIVFGGLSILIAFFLKKSLVNSGLVNNTQSQIKDSIKGTNLKMDNSPEGFIFGIKNNKKVYLPNSMEGHITIFGGSGQGKTSALLIPTLRNWNSPFFVIDISGDISKNVNCEKKVLLNPTEPSKSVKYNIFHSIDEIKDQGKKREAIEKLVFSLIAIPTQAQDAQLYFLNTARKILYASFLAFYDIGLDFVDICKIVYFNDLLGLAKMINETENEIAVAIISPILSENEKNTSGAKSVLNEKIKIFADNDRMSQIITREDKEEKTEFILSPNMLEEYRVFLVIPDKEQELYEVFLNIVVSQILEYISGRAYDPKKDQRILLGLDEFASLGYLNILSPFRKFRKNGANICVLTQSLSDLDIVYNQNERKVILDNSQYIVILSGNDNDTRTYFSNLVGKKQTTKKSRSNSKSGTSISESPERDFIIQPEEWKNLGDKLVLVHTNGYTKLKKNFYYKESKGSLKDKLVKKDKK